jgi:Cof subfamily protein (haloacid dehalogenase superfamily)
MAIRLLALDLDGTALDPYGDLTASAHDAVASVRRRGLRVVLCTGRRYRTALPMARALELDGPLVVNNGVLVKDSGTGDTLQHDFLPPDVFEEVLDLLREIGPPLVYVDRYHEGTDIVTERVSDAHPFQQEYLADNSEFCQVVDDLSVERPREVIMLSAMAEGSQLDPLRQRAAAALGGRVYTHSIMNKNYRGHILEFLSPTSGKWPALRALSASLGIAPEEIAAVGDDANDAEMIGSVGLGIAMGNALESVKQAADLVVRSNAEGGVAEAIERVLFSL